MNKNNSYLERNSGANVAEDRFEAYCKSRGVKFYRFGFDEKKGNIDQFWLLHPLLRALPDYIVPKDGKLYLVQVKGTNKMKLSDIEHYKDFDMLLSTPNTPLVFYFCFSSGIKVLSLHLLITLAQNCPIKKFENDGKEYIEIPV